MRVSSFIGGLILEISFTFSDSSRIGEGSVLVTSTLATEDLDESSFSSLSFAAFYFLISAFSYFCVSSLVFRVS